MNADDDCFTISKATIDDAKNLVYFLNTVGGETNYLNFGRDEFFISVEGERLIIAESIEQERCLILVGKQQGEIMSHLFLDRSPLKRLNHLGTIGLAVSQVHWRKSIGSQMMLTAIDWAKSKNMSKLELSVRCDNEPAIALYRQLGFSIEGRLTRSVLIDGVYFGNYLMGMAL